MTTLPTVPLHRPDPPAPTTHYATSPPRPLDTGTLLKPRPRLSRGRRISLAVLAVACAGIAAVAAVDPDLSAKAATTLIVFATAVWAWVCTRLDDTFVALAAALALALTGVTDTDTLFSTLGDDVVWLLLAAFVIAAGVANSGLATRMAAKIVAAARSPRGLAHLVTLALVLTAFAVPATSGRAALALPVFLALARVLADRPRIVRALAVLFPTVILLSAVGSLIGAGAHLISVQILTTATGSGISFVGWMLLGLPLAVVSSHLAAELVLWLFTTHADRARRLSVSPADIEAQSPTPVTGPLGDAERRAALLLLAVTVAWCTEPLHGLHPALVALTGAMIAASPRYGVTELGAAIKTVPWSLLLFMAATLSIGMALTSSGAAGWLADTAFGPLVAGGASSGPVFVVVVVVVSTAAHLVIQSRSARSAVLVPVVVALAPAVGVAPAAAVFLSTAAAGFCHTLTSSAKPVALFSSVPDVPTYTGRDLLRLSAFLAPLSVALVLGFAWYVWPHLGLPLFL